MPSQFKPRPKQPCANYCGAFVWKFGSYCARCQEENRKENEGEKSVREILREEGKLTTPPEGQ